jgi:hypothetical protein
MVRSSAAVLGGVLERKGAMSDNGRADLLINSQRYNENRNRFPAKQLEPYAGQYVAFNAEGTRILAHGADHFAVEAMLRAAGVDPATVAYERIPEAYEDTWL